MSVLTIERRIIVVLGIEHIINYGIAFLKQTMQSCTIAATTANFDG